MRRKSATPIEDEESRAPKRMKLSPGGANQDGRKTSSPPLLGVTKKYGFEGRQKKPDVVLISRGNRGGKINQQQTKEEIKQLKSELSKIWKRNEDGFEYELPPSSVSTTSVVGDLIKQLLTAEYKPRQPDGLRSELDSGGGKILSLVIERLAEKAYPSDNEVVPGEREILILVVERLKRIGREAGGDCDGNAARPSEIDEFNELVKEKLVNKLEELYGNDTDFESRIETGFRPQTALLSGNCMVAAHWPPASIGSSTFPTGASNTSCELFNRKFDVTGEFPFFNIMNFAFSRTYDGFPDMLKAFTPDGDPALHAGPYFAEELLKATNKVLLKKRFVEDGVTVVCGVEPIRLLGQLLVEMKEESEARVDRYREVLKIGGLDVEIAFNIVVTENGIHLIFETCHPSFGSSARTQPDTPEHQAKRLALDFVLDFVYLLDNNKVNDPARAGIFWER
ncbi:hypothetical protein JCM5350_002580 [Sporobolomyces pararoseus]